MKQIPCFRFVVSHTAQLDIIICRINCTATDLFTLTQDNGDNCTILTTLITRTKNTSSAVSIAQ